MPPIPIPSSSAIATVRVIDSTSTIHYPAKYFFEPIIPGHDDLNCPAFCFLITDASGKRNILFDLGVRKDWKTGLPSHQVEGLFKAGASCTVEKNVAEILHDEASGNLAKPKDLEAIIWSHHHFDHTGDPNAFPNHVPILVGPGFKEALLPGYPEDPKSSLPSSYWKDRELIELDFKTDSRKVQLGRLQAFDYFGDGSFYLVATPGHAPGHMSGLARVTANSFRFMGGDAAHHGGEIRPSEYLPLPDTVPMSSSKKYASSGCPGEILANLQSQRKGSKTTPFYESTDNFCYNRKDTNESIKGIMELDSGDGVFVILAHERSLLGQIPLFPEPINGWREQDLDGKTRWLFLDDFAKAVDDYKQGN